MRSKKMKEKKEEIKNRISFLTSRSRRKEEEKKKKKKT
jgi:hypothetical protein